MIRRHLLFLIPISLASLFMWKRADALPLKRDPHPSIPIYRGNTEFSEWDEKGRVTVMAFRIGAKGEERDFDLTPAVMADMFTEMERHDARVSAMHLSRAELAEVMTYDGNILDKESHRALIQAGLYAVLWGAQVRCHNILPPGVVLFTSDAFGEDHHTHEQWKQGLTVNDSVKNQELWLPTNKQPIIGYRPVGSSINRMRTDSDPVPSTHIWGQKRTRGALTSSVRGIGFPIEFGHS